MEQRTVTYAVVSHVTLPIPQGCAATIQYAETGSDLKERLQRLSDVPETSCLYLLREFPDDIIRPQLLEDVGQLPLGNLSVKVVDPEGSCSALLQKQWRSTQTANAVSNIPYHNSVNHVNDITILMFC